MKAPRFLHTVGIRCAPQHGDAVAAWLEARSGQNPAIYTDSRTRRSRVTAHLHSAAAARRVARAFTRELPQLRECGLQLNRRSMRIQLLRNEDWAESWKRHFRPIHIGRALLIRPDWIRQRLRPAQVEVVLNPGLSFGTGQHATTDFCLTEIVHNRPDQQARSMLDVGCGSGILAIAAAKLGYAPVVGFDLDAEAVRIASRNAATNGVRRRVRLTRTALGTQAIPPRRRFDLVCANLTSDVLMAHSRQLMQWLAPGGTLVLAGILRQQFPAVAHQFMALGLRIARSRTRHEWQSAAFVAAASSEPTVSRPKRQRLLSPSIPRFAVSNSSSRHRPPV